MIERRHGDTMEELAQYMENDTKQTNIIKAIEKLPSNYVGSKRRLLKNMCID